MDAEQKKARNVALAEAYKGGARAADLAKMSGMTVNHVRNIIKAQGVELRNSVTPKADAETRARIVADYAAGDTSAEVGVRYGVAQSTVLNYCRASGVEIRPQYRRPRLRNAEKVERNQRIAEEFTAGVTARELSAKYGLTRERIRGIVREVCDAKPAKQRVMEDLDEGSLPECRVTFQLVPDEQAMQSTAPEYVGPFGRPVTDAQRSALEEYKAGGFTRDIAERHGMTVGKLYYLAKLNGLYRQGFQNLERDRRIVDALVAGAKPGAIAEEYGFTVDNVYRIAKQHGISRDAIANGEPLAALVREPKIELTDTGIVRGEREAEPKLEAKVVPIKAAKARDGIDKLAWAGAGFLAATALSIAASGSGWFGC